MKTGGRHLFGRTVITTDEPVITASNVVEVLQTVSLVHAQNRNDIQYLWDYYRGNTPIEQKEKDVRPDINHKIAVNRANEIVTFKRGYGFGEPIQYIRRGSDTSLTDDIERLNGYMIIEDKLAEDNTLAEWMYVCGVGVRMVLPGPDAEEPFRIFTLDPRDSYVVYYNGIAKDPVMGVKEIQRTNKPNLTIVYTPTQYFEIEDGIVTKSEAHTLGDIPIFEYPANTARLGSFEIVLPLLDAINEVESNRLDDVVQFVNSFLALLGGTIDEETFNKLDELKMLCLPEGVDAKYLSVPMNQGDAQTLADNLYESVLTICGVPNRNGGSSTSDTGQATIFRDGWQMAESHMKSVETEFKRSERKFLRLVLQIVKVMAGTDLNVRDIEIKFSRRNYDNLQVKVQSLVTMLQSNKVHPELAFTHCGLFLDPESAYLQSKEWWESNPEPTPTAVEEVEVDDPSAVS